jgi:segregation and condensation protein B
LNSAKKDSSIYSSSNPTQISELEYVEPFDAQFFAEPLANTDEEIAVPPPEAELSVAVKPKPKKVRSKRATAAIAEIAKTRIYQLRKPARLPRALPRIDSHIKPDRHSAIDEPVAQLNIRPSRRKSPRLPTYLFRSGHAGWQKPLQVLPEEVAHKQRLPRHNSPRLPANLLRGEQDGWRKPLTELPLLSVEIQRLPRRMPPRLPFTLPRGGARIESVNVLMSNQDATEVRKIPRRSSVRLPFGLPRTGAEPRLVSGANSASSLDTAAVAPSRECNANIKRIVEAILFAADKPLSVKQIQQVFPELEQPDTLEIQDAIDAICADYLLRPVGLQKLASGWRFQVKEGLAYWVSRLFEERPPRYSRAMLETIAIIAYRQPVTRGEIEDIRGVSVSSGIIHTLLEREWIRVIAYREAPGRPALYGTTKQFLDYFNLSALDQLPTLEELTHFDFSHLPQQLTQQDTSERPQTELPAANEIHTAGEENPQAAIEVEDDSLS